jgi:hypothetical protein
MVTQRNWLDVYTYASWGGNADLPVFTEGQRFMPSQLLLAQARCCHSTPLSYWQDFHMSCCLHTLHRAAAMR